MAYESSKVFRKGSKSIISSFKAGLRISLCDIKKNVNISFLPVNKAKKYSLLHIWSLLKLLKVFSMRTTLDCKNGC